MLARIVRKLLYAIVISSIATVIAWLYASRPPRFRSWAFSAFDVSISTTKHPSVSPPVGAAKPVKRKPTFIYLVQTESCLSQHHLQPEFIGSPNLCSCEVFVLSYKSPCWKNEHSHVHYAFEKTSWSHGRNKLYELAKKENFDHALYYILLDDDIHLGYNGYSPEALKTRAPARVFEEFLLENEPAVGMLDSGFYYSAKSMMNKRQKLCTGRTARNGTPSLHITTTHFDASYNAIHRNASDHLLPYMTDFESTNWWHSQKYLIVAAEILFRGQVVMFTAIKANNGKHRSYPQDDRDKDKVYSYYVEEMVKRVPQKYRKDKFLTDLQANSYDRIENSLSVCLNLPPKYPIVPFAHFTWNL